MKLLPTLILVSMITALSPVPAEDIDFYIGTYTKKEGSEGIYRCRLNTETGAVSAPELAAEANNPTFLAVHPNRRFVYAAMENSGGAVGAFEIQTDGKLKPLNQQSTKGGGACHVWVNAAGTYAFAANYGGGSVAAFPIQPDGSLKEASGFVQHTGSSVNPKRQEKPHAHSIYTVGNSPLVYAADLGLDQVLVYKLGPDGSLTPNEPPFAKVTPGAGPRHIAFTPDSKFAYVINELSNTVTAFRLDAASGKLEQIQEIPTLPDGWTGGSSTAEIFVHPSGKFVYGSNRGHDSIVVYSVDSATGKLTLVEHEPTQGKAPRGFNLDPSGKFLVAGNHQSNTVVVFKVDQTTGALAPAGHTFELGAPVSIEFVPKK